MLERTRTVKARSPQGVQIGGADAEDPRREAEARGRGGRKPARDI